MTDFLTKELREGLAQARKLAAKKTARLRVRVGDDSYPVTPLPRCPPSVTCCPT